MITAWISHVWLVLVSLCCFIRNLMFDIKKEITNIQYLITYKIIVKKQGYCILSHILLK